jgi:uncharacterized protein
MAKPAGPLCNMKCSYCYYSDKISIFPENPCLMPEELMERYIVQRLNASPGPSTHFEWHGGEPTLAGLEYFRMITRIQKSKTPPGRKITNGLQTNGLLIDEAWASFLAEEGFSAGLSIDGPEDLHEAHRKTMSGGPAHAPALKAFALLKKHGVFCNVLCVLHSGNAGEPEKIYNFFKNIGASYIQFLPLVRTWEDGSVSALTVNPSTLKNFFCSVFDLWISRDVGKIVIQTFDEALRPFYGIPHALCINSQTCGRALVLEHNGNIYSCDHFVNSDHLLGNIKTRTIKDMSEDPALIKFGNDKRDKISGTCLECEALAYCNGGCPKDRINGLNYLCASYKGFFIHARPQLTRLAAHIRAGKPLRSFKTT